MKLHIELATAMAGLIIPQGGREMNYQKDFRVIEEALRGMRVIGAISQAIGRDSQDPYSESNTATLSLKTVKRGMAEAEPNIYNWELTPIPDPRELSPNQTLHVFRQEDISDYRPKQTTLAWRVTFWQPLSFYLILESLGINAMDDYNGNDGVVLDDSPEPAWFEYTTGGGHRCRLEHVAASVEDNEVLYVWRVTHFDIRECGTREADLIHAGFEPVGEAGK